jgi:hypothetical protein
MSTSVVEGTVEFVKQNAAGYYAAKMSDGQWYGCNKDKPEFDKGDNIRFEIVTNGRYLNMVMETVEMLGKSAAPARKAPPARSGGGAQKFTKDVSKDEYWKAKEARDIARDERLAKRDTIVQNEIRLQASRNAAIELMGIALSSGIVVLKDEKKKGQNFDILTTYVDKLTSKYYDATKAINAEIEAPDLDPVEAHEAEPAGDEEDFDDALRF